MGAVKFEKAPDIELMLYRVMDRFREEFPHINQFRVICLRSSGSTANAYARIWAMPKAWQVALDINTFYVLEVISEKFDRLPESEKEKTLLHEILHIPKTFSGALLPHVYGKDQRHIEERVDDYFSKKGKAPIEEKEEDFLHG